jgi:hypothetical protein
MAGKATPRNTTHRGLGRTRVRVCVPSVRAYAFHLDGGVRGANRTGKGDMRARIFVGKFLQRITGTAADAG